MLVDNCYLKKKSQQASTYDKMRGKRLFVVTEKKKIIADFIRKQQFTLNDMVFQSYYIVSFAKQ